MGKFFRRFAAAAASAAVCASTALAAAPVSQLTASAIANKQADNVLEYLDRGICAVNTGNGMLVSWRWTGSDSDTAAFKLYRDGTLIYTSTGNDATCYLDAGGNSKSKYRVDTYDGSKLTDSSDCSLISAGDYFDIYFSKAFSSACYAVLPVLGFNDVYANSWQQRAFTAQLQKIYKDHFNWTRYGITTDNFGVSFGGVLYLSYIAIGK